MNVTNTIKEKFKPVLNIVSIQTDASKELLGEQVNFMRECVNVSSRHANDLRGKTDPSAVVRTPLDASLEISSTWLSTFGRQWDILAKTGSAMKDEFRSAREEAKTADSEAESGAPSSAAKAESGSRKS